MSEAVILLKTIKVVFFAIYLLTLLKTNIIAVHSLFSSSRCGMQFCYSGIDSSSKFHKNKSLLKLNRLMLFIE